MYKLFHEYILQKSSIVAFRMAKRVGLVYTQIIIDYR